MEATAEGTIRPTRVLVDCGFGIRDLIGRLQGVGVEPVDIDAVFITHEHGDHVGCVQAFAKRFGVRVYASQGTADASRFMLGEQFRAVRDGEHVPVGSAASGLALLPFAVPHDAAEPLQLALEFASTPAQAMAPRRLGILTDLGHVTEHVARHLAHCHALLLECNHDPDLLAQSRYPPALQRRVGGNFGHLANDQAAKLLRAIAHDRLHTVVAAHLSQHNNSPEAALLSLERIFDQPGLLDAAWLGACKPRFLAATAADGCEWIAV